MPQAAKAAYYQRGGKRSSQLLPRILLLAAPLLILLSLACDDSADSDSPSASPTAPVDVAAIRDINFVDRSDVKATLSRIGGGKVAENEIAYADLTGDQREEAIVPITSGGTLGNLSYIVFTPNSDGASVILTRNLDPSSPSGLTMTVEDGALVEYVGEYGPSDPFCCPSVLRRTTFTWDGSKLQVGDEERVPAGQKKQ